MQLLQFLNYELSLSFRLYVDVQILGINGNFNFELALAGLPMCHCT